MEKEKLYTCAEVAVMFRVAMSTVWEWVREGRLTSIKVGRCYRIRESDLEKFVKERN